MAGGENYWRFLLNWFSSWPAPPYLVHRVVRLMLEILNSLWLLWNSFIFFFNLSALDNILTLQILLMLLNVGSDRKVLARWLTVLRTRLSCISYSCLAYPLSNLCPKLFSSVLFASLIRETRLYLHIFELMY